MANSKRYCNVPGCPNVLKGSRRMTGEYCLDHRCRAFSAAHAECVLGVHHKRKHLGKEGGEWGDDAK